jgi:hypothetical protein
MILRNLAQKVLGPKAEKPATYKPTVPDWVRGQREAADRFLAAPIDKGWLESSLHRRMQGFEPHTRRSKG